MLPMVAFVQLMFIIPDIEGMHPLVMVGAMLLAFAAACVGCYLVAAWICATSMRLVKSKPG
jgi:hypothetical protein